MPDEMTSRDAARGARAGRRRVLVTGASGYIAQQIVPQLMRDHDVVLTDVRRPPSPSPDMPEIEVLDILGDPHGGRLAGMMRGVDTVVHLAYRPAKRIAVPEGGSEEDRSQQLIALYEDEQLNIDLSHRIYQTALSTGVRRVVCASSNHASSWHEKLYQSGLKQTVYPDEYPRPASFYGWSKVAYESLGFLYACGSLGRGLEVVLVRICAPRTVDAADYANLPRARYFRDLAGYLSARDCAQLFERAVDTADISDVDGVPFLIVYAASNNARKYWSIESARRVLGYEPVDDSEEEFADDIRRMTEAPTPTS